MIYKNKSKDQDPLLGRPEKMDYLLHDQGFREELKDAGIIFCVDETTGKRSIEFGRGLLTQIAKLPDGESREAGIAVVHLRAETDEYEALLAAIQHVKGYCDNTNPHRAKVDVAEMLTLLQNPRKKES